MKEKERNGDSDRRGDGRGAETTGKCLIASQVGIAGCVVIEDEVTIWGQVGIISGITIASKAVLMAQAGVTKSLKGNKTYWGTPAQEVRDHLKGLALVKQIPKILEELKSKK